jgi:hypothetical protein
VCSWVKTLSQLGAGLAMAAAAAVVDLLGGIADCCCIPRSFGGAVPGETLDPCDRALAALVSYSSLGASSLELDISKRDQRMVRCLRRGFCGDDGGVE